MIHRITLVIDSNEEDGDPGKWEWADLLEVTSANVESVEQLEADENPSYGPGNPDWELDRQKEDRG